MIERIFGFLFAILASLLFLGDAIDGDGWIILEPAFALLFIGVVLIVHSYVRRRKKRAKLNREKDQAWQDEINSIGPVSELPIVNNPTTIFLDKGEVCHYQTDAAVLIMKNQVVGHTSGSRGVSVRVAKGLTLHTGGSRGHAIRDNVPYTYPGTLSITNKRIIMTGEKAFEKPINKLTALTPYGHEGCTLQFGNSSYTILMDHPLWVPKILELLGSQVSSD